MCSKPAAPSCKVIIWKNGKGLSLWRLVYAAALPSSEKPSHLSWAFEIDCEAMEYGHLQEREGWWVWSKQREWQLDGWAWLLLVAEYADPLKPHGWDWKWQSVWKPVPSHGGPSFRNFHYFLSAFHCRKTIAGSPWPCLPSLQHGSLYKCLLPQPHFSRILTLLGVFHVMPTHMLGNLIASSFHQQLEGFWAHTLLCKHPVFSTLGQQAVLYPGNRYPTLPHTHRRWL